MCECACKCHVKGEVPNVVMKCRADFYIRKHLLACLSPLLGAAYSPGMTAVRLRAGLPRMLGTAVFKAAAWWS